MNNLIGYIFSFVLFLFLILIFNRYSQDYDKIFEDVTFIAVENTASQEVLQVHELINEITDIHIEGVHQNVNDVVVSINVSEDGEIILVNNASGLGDLIEITYSYETHPTEYTSAFIGVIPTIMVLILVGGIAYVLINRR